MAIDITEVRPLYTTLIAAKYDELLQIKTTQFLKGMFKDNVTKVLNPAIDVRRGSEKVAVDVILGHQGNRNQVTKSTTKFYDLYNHNEYFDVNEMDSYWNLFGSTSISENQLAAYVNDVATETKIIMDKIDRFHEVAASQIFEFGTATSLGDGTVLNFNRKSGSMVDKGAGNYWITSGVNPYDDIAAGCTFIRQYGKFQGGSYNVIMGSQAWSDLLNNNIVQERNDIKLWKMDDLAAADMQKDGNTYHGTISCGPYICHIWQYPQYYEDQTGTLQPYINPKKIIILPVKTDFEALYGAVPQIVPLGTDTSKLIAQKFVTTEFINPEMNTHRFYTKSRGLLVPKAIDTIYTLQVVAS